MKTRGGFAAVLALFLVGSPAQGAESPRLWSDHPDRDRVLSELARRNGRVPESFRVDPATIELEQTFSGRFKLQSYVMQGPRRAPGMLEAISSELVSGSGLADRLETLARIGRPEGVLRQPDSLSPERVASILSSPVPIQEAIDAVYDGTKKRFQGNDLQAVIKSEASLPPDLRRELASLILATHRTALHRDALVKLSDFRSGGMFDSRSKKTAEQLREFLGSWWEDPGGKSAFRAIEPALESLDLAGMYVGAIQLAEALDRAGEACTADGFADAASPGFQHEWETPRGRIAVGGRGANEYRGAFTLILDLGGDDLYRGAGSSSGREPVSVVMDLGGADTYEPADSARTGPGGAMLGYAMVVDLGSGDDSYSGATWGCGFGFLGVGVIHDGGGNDTYSGQWLSQGAGLFGLGMILEAGGSDRYQMAAQYAEYPEGRGQGFGGPSGIGVVLDIAGADQYGGSPGDTCSGSGDLGSGVLVQGASSGVQDFRAGGVALLIDVAGDDVYEACRFAQGTSVGAGFGGLVDFSGNDQYRSGSNSQGSGARLGAGFLVDLGGNDLYDAAGTATRSLVLGAGSGLGLGVFLDAAGEDTYHCGEVSLGSSRRQGAGFFMDYRGEDSYLGNGAHSFAYSEDTGASFFRTGVPGVSVFVDLEHARPSIAAPGGLRFDEAGYFAPHGPAPALGGGVMGPGGPGDTAP